MALDSVVLKMLRTATKNRVGLAVSLGYPDILGKPGELSRQFDIAIPELMPTQYAKDSRRVHGYEYRAIDSEDFFDKIHHPLTSLDLKQWHGSEELFDLDNPREGFKGMFDVLIDGGTLEHCGRPGVALEAVWGMLKPGGFAIHLNPAEKDSHGWWSPHSNLYAHVYGRLVETERSDGLQRVLAQKTRISYPSMVDHGVRGRIHPC